jgi:hypothetical protein
MDDKGAAVFPLRSRREGRGCFGEGKSPGALTPHPGPLPVEGRGRWRVACGYCLGTGRMAEDPEHSLSAPGGRGEGRVRGGRSSCKSAGEIGRFSIFSPLTPALPMNLPAGTGRDAFHCVPNCRSEDGDAVERVPTGFRSSMRELARRILSPLRGEGEASSGCRPSRRLLSQAASGRPVCSTHQDGACTRSQDGLRCIKEANAPAEVRGWASPGK